MKTLNKKAEEVHQANQKWWHDLETGERLDRNKGELLMLVISEIAEAMEGERKDLMDDHLPHRKMAEVEMADALIRLLDIVGSEEEYVLWDWRPNAYVIADISDNKGEALFSICRTLTIIMWNGYDFDIDEVENAIHMIYDYCYKFGYDLEGAYIEKMEYNKTRKDHTKEGRLAEGGKKW